MPSHIRTRAKQLPHAMRQELVAARRLRRWSQAELGQRVGLPQAHISGIETGKIVPRFDTLLELARVLDRDLLMIPRELVPVVRSLVAGGPTEYEERPLYTPDEEEP